MRNKLSFFHTTIMIYMFQSGVVILSMPHILAYYFGTNGWLAVILISLIVNVNIGFIFLVYRLGKGRSVFEILEQSVSKVILFPLYIALAILWTVPGSLVSKDYVHIFQLFSFPNTPPMLLTVLMGLLALMLLVKGIFVIERAATIFFWLIIWMLLLLFAFSYDFEWVRLTPFVFKEGDNFLLGGLNLLKGFLGYELSLFLFPYSDKRTKLIQAVIIANVMITLVYFITCFIAYGFYSLNQLKGVLYPVIDMMSYIKFPFVQRVENLFYGFFMFTNLFSTVAYVWAAKEACQRVFKKVKPGILAVILIIIGFSAIAIPDVTGEVREWLAFLGFFEIGVAFILPVLLILVLITQRIMGGAR